MNEADFVALNEHLDEVLPLFDSFCARHGFTYVDRTSLGRYPRIRIEKQGLTIAWIDLWMEYDANGERFETFRRDLPYELSAGAYFVEQIGSTYGVRFDKCLQRFTAKPFDQVAAVLQYEMEACLPTLATWTLQHLKDHGTKMKLG